MLLVAFGVCTHTIRNEIVTSQISLPATVEFIIIRLRNAKILFETKFNSTVGNLVRRVVEEHERCGNVLS
jgi:hypothetical protein